ncbi:hypothetical protein BTM25_33060 [Actinomadura rubteroloni]|uniref:DUF6879 domain-containing protein n=1 Tax=Actinomadura rubteroloni TaxID=1926885 RepID=A0A2P4UHY7_9ACTN|nr:DUF6879 family protein [Actinomadura rubteroloni]POM24672.1 hypothetical protein BTM25_33060 [Actinomadura rubteroloni]
MELISAETRDELFDTFEFEALHLELRDHYATGGGEADKFAAWKAGKPWDEAEYREWMRPWCDKLRAATSSGRVYRDAKLVSEPLSDYHRWGYPLAGMLFEAGQQVRFVPRRLVSTIALPGNDCWVFDRKTVVFNVFNGADDVVERQRYTEPEVVGFCLAAFEAVWELGIPQPEYKPG